MAANLDRLANDLRAQHPEFSDSLNALANLGRSIGIPENLPHDSFDSPQLQSTSALRDVAIIRPRLVIALQESVEETRSDRINELMGLAMWEKLGRELHPTVKIEDLVLPNREQLASGPRYDGEPDYRAFPLWGVGMMQIRSHYNQTMKGLSWRDRVPSVGDVRSANAHELGEVRGMSLTRIQFVTAFLKGPR